MDASIKQMIISQIGEIEKEHNVEILYALESGSRAWGFESVDSDYDVRFIYKNDVKWYLSVLPKRDVIEYPIVDIYDYSGWDLRKTLYLMNKSNPVLFEWMKSPIVYKKDPQAYDMLSEAARRYFSPISSIYHYLHMASGNYRSYLQGDMVKGKKYFYVLRPVFSCLWIEKYKESPPIEFDILLHNLDLDTSLIDAVTELLVRKKSGVEMGLEKSIPVINTFLDDMIKYFESQTTPYREEDKPDSKYLDEIFYELVRQ